MLDPTASGRVKVASAADPSHYSEAVAAAVERIRAGELQKVVLAREVRAEAPQAHDPTALFGALRELFPSCYCFCVGTPEAAFLGASPELLVRRRGAGRPDRGAGRLDSPERRPGGRRPPGRAAAQSRKRTARSTRSWCAGSNGHCGRILSGSRPAREPEVIKVANIQHLATPIHAQLAEPRSAVELAGMLHPTPAVGGEPRAAALSSAIAELEPLDRGWYAGPVGWTDATEDGEFCVALRSALLRDRTAHLFAGAGIVADSDPEAELAETELKLDALLPLVSS